MRYNAGYIFSSDNFSTFFHIKRKRYPVDDWIDSISLSSGVSQVPDGSVQLVYSRLYRI